MKSEKSNAGANRQKRLTKNILRFCHIEETGNNKFEIDGARTNPEITKKKSTPRYPFGMKPVLRWNRNTNETEIPRII
jgi:hypothetical protein